MTNPYHKPNVQIGDKVIVWWKTKSNDRMAEVLDILPYTGRYPEFFNCVLVLEATNNRSGKTEMAYKR